MKREYLVIADDHALLRQAIAERIAPEVGLEVVGYAESADQALEVCGRTKPGILLLDIVMPGRDPMFIVQDILALSPETWVVLLSAFCRDALVELALKLDVRGYFVKTDSPESLIQGLRRIIKGERVYSEIVRARIDFAMAQRDRHPCHSKLASLTTRELEVLKYIGTGFSNKQMAGVMHLSRRTVERHVARTMDVLAIRHRSALTKFALEQGLVI